MNKNINPHYNPYYASGNITRDQEKILHDLKHLYVESKSINLSLHSENKKHREIGAEQAVRSLDFMQRMKSSYQYGVYESKHTLSRHQKKMERRFEWWEWKIREMTTPIGGWDIKHTYIVRCDQDPKTGKRTEVEWNREKFIKRFRTDEVPLNKIKEN